MNQMERREYWRGHIEAYAKSGLTKLAYCRKHGMSRNSLLGWMRRLESPTPAMAMVKAKSRGAFISLRALEPEPRSNAVRFTLPGGIEFTSGSYPDPAWLRSVMGVRG